MNERKLLILLISFAIITRIIFGLVYYSDKEPDTWEYGAIAKNIIAAKGYSLFYIENQRMEVVAKPNSIPSPSAYMMPGYVFFLIPFFLIGKSASLLIIISQALIAGLTGYLLFKFVKKIYSINTAFLSLAIFAFLPEFIFSANTIGPTTIFHALLIGLLLILLDKEYHLKQTITIGLLSVSLIFFRPESLLFISLILIINLFKKKFKFVLIISFICFFGLSFWIIRNEIVFHRFIPLTTSTGLNLYRGHNPYYNGFWMDENIHRKILKIEDKYNFEIIVNDIYLNEANKSISNNPAREISSSLEKIGQLWFFDPGDYRSSNLFYLIPWSLLLILFLYGFFTRFDMVKQKNIYLFLLTSSLVAVVFFVLPRYQTLMKIALIPLAAQSAIDITRKLLKRE